MRKLGKLKLGIAAAVVAALLGGVTANAMADTKSDDIEPKRDIELILEYTVAAECEVYPNYPKEGVIGNDIGWKIGTGDVVAWRYNVNQNWAVISDKKHRNSADHPWWGFVRQDCVGTSIGGEAFPEANSTYPAGEAMPERLLEGRSAAEADRWRAVNFRPGAAGNVVDDHKRVSSKGTLRDPAKFVIGNVAEGWHVHMTDQTSNGWTLVYVPNAQRWGWLENTHL